MYRTHGFRNQGLLIEAALSNVMPSEPTGQYLLQVSSTLTSASLEVLTPKTVALPETWKKSHWTSSHAVAWHLSSFMPERGDTILVELIDPGPECHCVSMAVCMHWYPPVISPWMGEASSILRAKKSGGYRWLSVVMLPQQEIWVVWPWVSESASFNWEQFSKRANGWGLSDGCTPWTWRISP